MVVEDYRENYGQGFISLWRSIKKHWIFENDKWFKWWVIMLFEVNHSPKKVSIGYEVIEVKAGQSVKSLRTWAAILKTDTKQLMKFLKMLEKDGMISKKTIGKGKRTTTLINISNYSQYQAKMETQRHTQQHTLKPHNDPTNNNGNNYNNENNEIVKELTLKQKMKSIWMKEFPDYDFKQKDWADIAAIRNNITDYLKNKQGDKYFNISEAAVEAEFARIVQNFPEWYRQNALFLSSMADKNKFKMILNKIQPPQETVIAHDPRNKRQ